MSRSLAPLLPVSLPHSPSLPVQCSVWCTVQCPVWHHCTVPCMAHCMAPLYGATVWCLVQCHCMAPLYSATVWCHCTVPCTVPLYGTVYGATVQHHCMAHCMASYGTEERGARGEGSEPPGETFTAWYLSSIWKREIAIYFNANFAKSKLTMFSTQY